MQKTEQIVQEIGKAFVGNLPAVRKILLVLSAGGHVLLEDIPGVGKTTLAASFATSMGLHHNRL